MKKLGKIRNIVDKIDNVNYNKIYFNVENNIYYGIYAKIYFNVEKNIYNITIKIVSNKKINQPIFNNIKNSFIKETI